MWLSIDEYVKKYPEYKGILSEPPVESGRQHAVIKEGMIKFDASLYDDGLEWDGGFAYLDIVDFSSDTSMKSMVDKAEEQYIKDQYAPFFMSDRMRKMIAKDIPNRKDGSYIYWNSIHDVHVDLPPKYVDHMLQYNCTNLELINYYYTLNSFIFDRMREMHGEPSFDNPVQIFIMLKEDVTFNLCVPTVKMAHFVVGELEKKPDIETLNRYNFVGGDC